MNRAQADRIVVVGDTDAVLGLGLLGFEGVALGEAPEPRDALAAVLRDPSVGVVLLTEDWAAQLHQQVEAAAAADAGPLVVEIPAPGAVGTVALLHQRIERAIGIKLEI